MNKNNTDKTYKTTCEIIGYIAVILLFAMFALTTLTFTFNFHFKGDVFVAFALAGLFETCSAIYVEYRESEKEKKNINKDKGIQNE